MKRKLIQRITAGMTALLFTFGMTAFPAAAYTPFSVTSDLFSVENGRFTLNKPPCDISEEDADALDEQLILVNGVQYDTDGNVLRYNVMRIYPNMYGNSIQSDSVLLPDQLAAIGYEETFAVGDIVKLGQWTLALSDPSRYEIISPAPRTIHWSAEYTAFMRPDLGAQEMWFYFPASSAERIGSGTALLGEDLTDVLRVANAYAVRKTHCMPVAELFTIGDTTDDGIIDIMDCIALNKSILGASSLSDIGYASADLDADGTISTTDALLLLKQVVQNKEESS